MLDRSTKEESNLEISLGLLAGYCVAVLIYKFTFDKSWGEAFSDEKLILGMAGIGLSLFMIAPGRSVKAKEVLKICRNRSLELNSLNC